MKKISGTGCCLLDYLFTDMDFSSEIFQRFQSKKPGDGGLVPGNLVFSSDLAEFSGLSEEKVLELLSGRSLPDSINLGGPGVVAMIHASQMLHQDDWKVCFTGAMGDEEISGEIKNIVRKYPIDFTEVVFPGEAAASTTVLSDPGYNGGAGERTFINRLGAAEYLQSSDLVMDFFNSDIVLWGGTALVPRIHNDLTALVKKVKAQGGLNVVGTVYDFLNESKNPYSPWPLGNPEEPAYPWIDLLITDYEEALRLTGESDGESAIKALKNKGCGSFIITKGKEPLCLFSDGKGNFEKQDKMFLPVSPYVDADLKAHPEKRGDTTGCGDNFVGGVLVSIARQIKKSDNRIDLVEAAVEGICSGGLALYINGGCRPENYPGEKEHLIKPIREHYKETVLLEVAG